MKIFPINTFNIPFGKKNSEANCRIEPLWQNRIRTYYSEAQERELQDYISSVQRKIASDPILYNIMFAQGKKSFLNRARKVGKQNSIDMDKIKSIILPQTQCGAKLRSFENSDKKYVLDKYQRDTINAFKNGMTCISTAPTGSGKTLIAQYGIEDVLKKGKKIIYLSPLKALSNEKFVKFSEQFGQYDKDGNFLNSDNVGIITGDIVINPDAQLIIMTTEIYRNMVNMEDEQKTAEAFRDFAAVIYDEFHYLNDPDRGTVWEEAVISTPKHMQQMMLTATASNANQIKNWLEKLNPSIKVHLTEVQEDERYVPLNEYVFGYKKGEGCVIEQIFDRKINIEKLQKSLSNRQQETVKELESLYNQEHFVNILKRHLKKGEKFINAEEFCQALIQEKNLKEEKARQIAYVLSDAEITTANDIRLGYNEYGPSISSLLRILEQQNKTPALFFVFSKKRCKKQLDEVPKKLGTLLTPEQSKKVLDIVNEAKDKGIYLGENFDEDYLSKLLMGYAVHHAGMLPAYKSLVEKLSREGLVKACFATETLLAGINMPFKTTVFTSLEKFNGRKNVQISPTTYKQGAGRAGRRGIDDIGNVIICPTTNGEFKKFREIINSNDTNINSSLKFSYATLLQNSTINNIDDFLGKSFYVFQSGNTQKIKKEAKQRLNFLKERGFLTYQDGKFVTTKKGEMAKNVYGINQILFCELMTNSKYTNNLDPEELIALMLIFADIKDDRPKKTFSSNLSYLADKLTPALELAEEISKEQTERKINDEIKMSTNLVPAILKFAYLPNSDEEECLEVWKEIFEELKSQYLIMHEGDLLRVFNSTIDLLKTIIEVSDNPELVKKANMALKCLQKPPLTDILKYELNIK